jgi:hypothetical protein
MSLVCTYPAPRATKYVVVQFITFQRSGSDMLNVRKDQSIAVAINAIRRLEVKIEDLSTAIKASQSRHDQPTDQPTDQSTLENNHSVPVTNSQRNTQINSQQSDFGVRNDRADVRDAVLSPQASSEPSNSPYPHAEPSQVNLSFSQHGVTLWPAIRKILPPEFVAARDRLPRDYIVAIESERAHLSMAIDCPIDLLTNQWIIALPMSIIKDLADAYFAVFNRNTPILDKFYFFSNTLGTAMQEDFGYSIESCLVLNVLALGCLAIKAHEEGDFALPSRYREPSRGFLRPEWYELILEESPGLRFFNEARKRFGFLMCQNDLQAAQFYVLSTLYYAHTLRPIDSWTTVNRAALCCISMLKRTESLDFDKWENDVFSRVFWSTLMYETIITQELNLPLSGLLEYEADMPIPKFTPCPRPRASISGLLVDEDESYFNFHFLAQAAHRILLTRIRHNVYTFIEKEGSPTPTITAEMHHQIEQWRANLPPPLRFPDVDDPDDSPSPAQVIAKAMLKSRYLVAKFHIGRPFLYKALHAPQHMTDSEYSEVREGLKGGMYWPAIMGLCTQMTSALPVKFGWLSQCFGQVLLFHAVARSPDVKLKATLPEGWRDWVAGMVQFIEGSAKDSPGIAKDAELLRLL